MTDSRVENTPDCIETLIKKQENYPYYYWFIWIFFLILFAGVLSVRACQELRLDNKHADASITKQQPAQADSYKNIINKTQLEQNFILKAQKQNGQIVCKK